MKNFVLLLLSLINLGTFLVLVEGVPPLQEEVPKRYRYEPSTEIGEGIEGKDDKGVFVQSYRLPSSLVPTDYTIRILPVMDENPLVGEQWSAPGSVTIRVDCVEDTNLIILHKFLLEINETSIMVKNVESGAAVPVTGTNYDDEFGTHFYNITTGSPLVKDQKYDISMDFVAKVATDRSNGLYRAAYTVPGPSGPVTKYMAGTQLEPARARQVFPCFDEPRWKSVFHVTIGRNSNYLSLANGKIIKIEPHESFTDYVWETYEPTIAMPTYLFAMAVADYAEAKSELYRLPIGVYAAPHLIKAGYGDYSAEASARIMDFFETHYEVDHPMLKVDSILVPGKGGAMENYGLVTYGNFFMYYPGETTESQRQGLVSIISHELAHQWFGNLVTCEWWSDIWLNEGFATYVSYLGMEPFYNEFFPRKWILTDAVQNAYKLDAAANSHPIVSNNVNTLAEIDSHFSSLQYDKGASLIRMMEGFLTEATLNKGLRAYLKRKSNMVAVQDDLFQDLNEAAVADGAALPAGKTVKDVMDTWTLQKGFPLVRVTRAGSTRVYLSQERFMNSAARVANKTLALDPNDLWEVPISYSTSDAPDFQNHVPKTWLAKNTLLTSLVHDTTKWIMLNNEGTGFYRVLYDVQMTNLIHTQLLSDSSVISPLSRSQLLDDYFNLAFQDYVSIESALRLTQYLDKESDFIVWTPVLNNLRPTFSLLSSTSAFEPFRAYFEPKLSGALTLVGVEQPVGDKGAVVMLRNNLLDWGCAMNNAACVKYAGDLLAAWRATPATNPFPIDVQAVLYCAAIANGGVEAFDFFVDRYKADTSEVQKSRLATALGCSNDGPTLDRLLALTINETSGISKADSALARYRVAGNSLGRVKAFEFMGTSLAEIIAYHGNDAGTIGTLVTTLSGYYGSQTEADNLRKFVEDNSEALAGIRTTLNNAMAAVDRNIVWMSKFYEPMKTWFETETAPKLH